MKNRSISAMLIFAGLLAGFPVAADTIFDNGAPGASALLADSSFYLELADDFVLQQGESTVTDVHWWGLYFDGNTPPAADDFTIRILADAGGVPDTAFLHEIAVTDPHRADTGLDLAGSDIYQYSADFSAIALTAGTTYWISIFNDSTNDDDDFWYWMASSATGNAYFRESDGGAWEEEDAEMAFTLTNDNLSAIPEPGTVTLLGLGLFALAMRARRAL
ncbi:MAG: PEP-CTERM sorting domain-containing protein [Candidatus Hydrogenedentes bacterium]|nr:PEP-CTERM sorting domain-containing protein [Candidatus Hydrogenedentota bacterium]